MESAFESKVEKTEAGSSEQDAGLVDNVKPAPGEEKPESQVAPELPESMVWAGRR